jgi:nucleotide-binding universal stress UspA family protein
MVPLDGSTLAERALPTAARVARATSSTLVLVRIVPTTAWQVEGPRYLVPAASDDGDAETQRREALEYLERTAASLRADGTAAQVLAAFGEPTSSLLELESSLRVGLVVMTTHGCTGLQRVALGSVADHLVRNGRMPVLLARAFVVESQLQPLELALVPLDGSALAEVALDLATQLAGSLLHRIILLRVVQRDMDPSVAAGARAYLERQRAHLAQLLDARGCTVDQRVLTGDPAEHITQAARDAACLVIVATHGATGGARWALGHVADQIVRNAAAPLLLVLPARAEAPSLTAPTASSIIQH